ncbi:MAG: sensor hybrid histidine kinase [Candidatus Angelobacter sp.]|nr:sensor hybrid histidine kinase [Candidatus Angelobacter sp.]
MVSPSDILNAKVLLVDDQAANVRVLERMLLGAGYASIQSTMDPREVCELHRKNRYALILLDLQMPGMDGFQVMDGLKEIETDGYLPVLVLTATPDHKLRALKAGAKDFVSKPFDLSEVLMRVHNMLEVRLLHLETKNLYDRLMMQQKLAEQSAAALLTSEKLAVAGRLAGVLAHEINNPLQAVSNLLVLLETLPGLDNQAREYTSLAVKELGRVVHLVRQSLGFFCESNIPTATNVAEVLDGMLVLYAKQIEAKQIRVSTQYRLGGTIQTYPREIRQVFSTLLVNAMDATAKDGAIVVRANDRSEWKNSSIHGVRITVADSGVGIPLRAMARVFEPFYTTKGEHGTGLGLWVTHGIVHRLGGSIRVRSKTQPGKSGTCFSVFLPGQPAKLNLITTPLSVGTQQLAPVPQGSRTTQPSS